MKLVPYSSTVGSVMYIMISRRPDISHVVSLVSKFMANPGRQHWEAVEWICRYLKGTSNVGLMYEIDREKVGTALGFVDSDYAGNLDKRRSLTGYVFMLCGNAISWKASLQSIVALSTTEAEYIAITEVVKEALWVKGLVNELGMVQDCISVMCDSQSAIHLSKNKTYHERTKHFDVRLHFVRDVIA